MNKTASRPGSIRLRLQRSTLRTLSAAALVGVGGGTDGPTDVDTCINTAGNGGCRISDDLHACGNTHHQRGCPR